LGKLFKSIAPIGGAVLGGFLGGPGGALLGGALGGSLGGTGDVGSPPNIMGMASGGGFNGDIFTNAYRMSGPNLSRVNGQDPNALNRIQATDLPANSAGLGGLRGNIASLREQVRPGFGRLTEARVTAVRNAGAESIGNLRESLARRGVMGSSFANDAETRVRLATSQDEQLARAEAFVGEMSMQLGLNQEDRAILGQQAAVLNQRASIIAQTLDRELQELSVAGNIRNGLNAAITQQASQMATLQALQMQQNAQNQAGFAGLGTMGGVGLFGKGGPFENTRFFG
jgi:hypothetical protein